MSHDCHVQTIQLMGYILYDLNEILKRHLTWLRLSRPCWQLQAGMQSPEAPSNPERKQSMSMANLTVLLESCQHCWRFIRVKCRCTTSSVLLIITAKRFWVWVSVYLIDEEIDEVTITEMQLCDLNKLGIKMGHAAKLKRILRVSVVFVFYVVEWS